MFFFFSLSRGKRRDGGSLAISLPLWLTVVGSSALITPTLPTLRPFFDCCIYHWAVVLYIMVIGKWMSSSGLMCIPCHTFQSFIKIKIQLSAQWTPVDAWFYLRYGNCCFQPSRRRINAIAICFCNLVRTLRAFHCECRTCSRCRARRRKCEVQKSGFLCTDSIISVLTHRQWNTCSLLD